MPSTAQPETMVTENCERRAAVVLRLSTGARTRRTHEGGRLPKFLLRTFLDLQFFRVRTASASLA